MDPLLTVIFIYLLELENLSNPVWSAGAQVSGIIFNFVNLMCQAFVVGFSMWSTSREFDIYFIYLVENFEYKKILVVEADSSIFLLKWNF